MVAMIDAVTNAAEPAVFTVEHGTYWRSFDRFKTQGAAEIERNVPPGKIGRLNVKGTEFVVVRSETWNEVYGLARDVSRFREGVLTIREAVKLFVHVERDPESSQLAISLLRRLTFQLPNLPTSAPPHRDITFSEQELAAVNDEDLDFDLNPMESTAAAAALGE